MSENIEKRQVILEGTVIYTAPARILKKIEVGDGIVILYDAEEINPSPSPTGEYREKTPPNDLWLAKKNILKINFNGQEVWRISAAVSSRPGYEEIYKEAQNNKWYVYDGRYLSEIDLQTGQIGHSIKY